MPKENIGTESPKRRSNFRGYNAKGAKKKSAPKTVSPAKSETPVKIYFLGGLNEVGKNIAVYECNNDMIVVDCGMAFPDEEMPGVDLVIPDFTFIKNNADKIRGVFLTHGHEDHIGSVPYLLREINIPVYGTGLTLGLLSGKLREHNLLSSSKLNVVKPGDTIECGCFNVEFIHVTHSIPDAVAFAIRCPAGTIFQTGDYKIDSTPIDGDMIDLARISQIGTEGVLALLSDSTNAERPGYSESEKKVGETFETLFRKAENHRLIIASFASNIHRIQQIIDVAGRLGRKVAVSGRSMENSISVSMELGYLNVPDGLLISLDKIKDYPPEKLVIVTTGSQGEPLSALHRMAFGEHRKVAITPHDCVIISANPIPGNEKMVDKIINELMKLGAEVVYERMYDVHVSGHACQEEQKMMISLLKPKYFIPVHGEFKHLCKHARLAGSMGIPPENIYLADNGKCVQLTKSSMKNNGSCVAGQVFVDGYGVGDVGSIVIRDRKRLAADGLVIVVIGVDHSSGEIVSGPEIVSRGFVYVREAEPLIEEARHISRICYENCIMDNIRDWTGIKNRVKDDVSKLMYERTKRNPMVLPIIMDC